MKSILLKLPQILILLAMFVIIGLGEGQFFNKSIAIAKKTEKSVSQNSDTLAFLQAYFPDHTFASQTETNSIIVKNKSGDFVAELLCTSPTCKEISGFGGEVPFIIVLNNKNTIEKLILLPNSETPGWVAGLEEMGFFNSWNGLTPAEALNKKVDAVTGSTYTSTAVINSMSKRLSVYTSSLEQKKSIDTKRLLTNGIVLLAILFALISFLFPAKLKKVRWLLHLSNIGIFGFIAGDFLSVAFFHNTIIHGIDPVIKLTLLIVCTLSVLLPLFTNKSFYCHYACPYGSLQDLAGKITRKKLRLPQGLYKVLRWVPYVYLFILLILVASGVKLVLEDFQPFMAFSYKFAAVSAFVMAGGFLVLAVFMSKPWCLYFCPTGALFEILRKPLFFKNKKHVKK